MQVNMNIVLKQRNIRNKHKNKYLSNFLIKLLFFNKKLYICISKNNKCALIDQVKHCKTKLQ